MTTAEKREPNDEPIATDDGQALHPVEPAEGAPNPGEDADAPQAEHPTDPAEG